MPVFDFECPKGHVYEDYEGLGLADKSHKCPVCGAARATRLIGGFRGHKMPAESSPAYQAWFASEKTQAKLKTGEWIIAPKSADLNHK